jgi:MraZ protein
MFMGEYEHTIDAKGRLIIPARLREELGERPVVTKGLDGCLFAYPPEEFAQQGARLRSLPTGSSEARSYTRVFFAGASECEFDRQGRILIPGNLREYARLEKDVMILGVSSRVEIWAKEEWLQYSAKAAASYEEVAEKLLELDPGL